MSESSSQVEVEQPETVPEPMEVSFPEVKTEQTSIEDGIALEGVDDGSVQYVTMTPEEAAAAGIVTDGDEDQVMTTSLQFDPANPSVLYTADGTPINKEDLSPEERALVETALQQHLAEQEAEQQLALIDSHQSEMGDGEEEKEKIETPVEKEEKSKEETKLAHDKDKEVEPEGVEKTEEKSVEKSDCTTTASSATQLMQSLVENAQKSKVTEEKLPSPPPLAPMSTARSGGSAAGGIKYEEKIVIRQGQPHVVRVPVQSAKPKPVDKPIQEVSDVLASLMPKAEIGKDGGQVIRIHQSQITEEQLNALKNNPNVRLVYRPPGGGKASSIGSQTNRPKKRGRPRKNQELLSQEESNSPESPDNSGEPPAKTRSGRLSKPPVYSKDYLTPKIEPAEMETETFDADYKKYAYMNKPAKAYISPGDPTPKRRGRPPLGVKKHTTTHMKSKGLTYAHKIEALRAQDAQDSNFSVQSIAYNKPTLTPIEQAISTRRKNRLTELLGACSSDEIMEVALPHLARGFSLWEFLVTKVEKNKKSRVHFADVYKEYESLHKYIGKLAEKYKQELEDKKLNQAITPAIDDNKEDKPEEVPPHSDDGTKKATEQDKKADSEEVKINKIKINCKALASSLGLQFEELEDAEIPLIDPQDALGPYITGTSGQRYSQMNKSSYLLQDKLARNKNVVASTTFTTKSSGEGLRNIQAKKVQSTPSMPPLKPLGAMSKQKQAETALLASVVNDTNVNTVTGTVETQSLSKSENQEPNVEPTTGAETLMLNQDTTIITAPEGTGPQLIQIGQGDDQQLIEVPEGYSLIQTPEGLVMSQPGTTLTQGDDGAIYITYADGTTTPLSAAQQQSVQMETVESLLSLDGTTQ